MNRILHKAHQKHVVGRFVRLSFRYNEALINQKIFLILHFIAFFNFQGNSSCDILDVLIPIQKNRRCTLDSNNIQEDIYFFLDSWCKVKDQEGIEEEQYNYFISNKIEPNDFCSESFGLFVEALFELKKPQPDESLGYELLLSAYQKAKFSNNKIILSEILKTLIDLLVFKGQNLDVAKRYLQEHKEIAYDETELIFNDYFYLRYLLNYHYELRMNSHDIEELRIPALQWEALLERARTLELHNSYVNILAARFAYLKHFENNIQASEDVLYSAYEYSQTLFGVDSINHVFKSLGNLADFYIKRNNYDKAIEFLQEAKRVGFNSQRAQNKIVLLKRLEEAFEKSGQADSAYFYSKIRTNTLIDQYAKRYDIEISRHQRMFDKKEIQLKLDQERVLRNQHLITSWIFGVLLIATLIIGWLIYKLVRSKNRLLKGELSDKENEIQIKAVTARLEGEENERKRVALVLHDSISSLIAAVGMHLEALRRKKNSETLTKTQSLVGQIGDRVSNLSHTMFPPILAKLGLTSALEELCQQYSNDELTVSIDIIQHIPKIDSDLSWILYNIIQELLRNVIRHSEASSAILRVDSSNDSIIIEVVDNGIGFKMHDNTKMGGIGLPMIKARIKSLNGQIELGSDTNGWTFIRIGVPVKDSQFVQTKL